jgi:uncharacterized protein YbjQ (UPF0145 family)
MIITTTATIDGKPIQEYLGVAAGEAIMGANVLKDFSASIRDLVGGRSGSYEKTVARAREIALNDLVERAKALGANAIVGVDVDYETIDRRSENSTTSMLMVSVSGTAVRVAE